MAAAAALVLTFAQSPGQISPDTKLDLTANPLRFLTRAFTLWNSELPFGQAQNQAYGYLFPMGPVFLLGDAVGAPGWAVQRVWWTLLLVVGFVGAERVARRLAGLPTVPALLVGGAFALAALLVSRLGGGIKTA